MPVSPQQQQGYPAAVLFESREGGTQRVVMLPLDFGTSALGLAQQLEKHSGIDIKHMQVLQQHIYTGEVISADSQHNCGSSNNAFIPHGVGTLVYLLYAKSVGKGTTVAGLPHTIVTQSFGEVEELRGAILLGFTMYKGSFRFGRRHGSGKLTVYPRYRISCTWNDDTPVLDGTQCILEYLAKTNSTTSHHGSSTSNTTTTIGDKKMRGLKSSSKTSLDYFTAHISSQYIGMTSLISSGVTPNRASFSGLIWAEQARFVADGVGEMLYPHGVRYCGCWQCGQRHGFGVEYDPNTNTLYMGGFLYDHREGPGTLHYCNTGAMLCGSWKEGKLTDTANAVLPTWPFVLQGALWKNYENWSFDHGTLLRSSGSLSGVWEPLFSNFDEVLASVSNSQQGFFPNTTKVAKDEVSEGVDISTLNTHSTDDKEEMKQDDDDDNDSDDDDDDVNNFLPLLSSMMQRPEFMALLVPFQRCFYFLYKPCTGIRHYLNEKKEEEKKRNKKEEKEEEGKGKGKNQGMLYPASFPEGGDFASQQHSVSCSSSTMSGFSPSRVAMRKSPSDDVNIPRQNTHRTQRNSEVKCEKHLSSFLLQLREFGRSCKREEGKIMGELQGCCWSSPSWCEEMGMGNRRSRVSSKSNLNNNNNNESDRDSDVFHCFHTTSMSEELAKRMPTTKLFECAMHDLSSFVSSVRLRLLSYVAAHPAAFHISVDEKILAVCWDSVFALVAPVIHDLAAAVEVEATTATTLAIQRCATLTRADFIPQSILTETKMNVSSENTEEIVTERCRRIFASSVHHNRCIVLQTTNGDLLQFGSTVISNNNTSNNNSSNNIMHDVGVYASPAEMFETFSALYNQALSLFPHKSILQERWISSSILTAFTHTDELDPRNALSPLALLRILNFLASDVNPRYPFSWIKNDKSNSEVLANIPHSSSSYSCGGDTSCKGSPKKKNLTGGNTRDIISKNVEYELGSCIDSTSSSVVKGVSEVLVLLAAVRGGVERLQNVYPSIRYSIPIPLTEYPANSIKSTIDDNNNNNNNNTNTNNSVSVSMEKRNVVYPLDELEVRTRFVMLAAADFTRQYCKYKDDTLESDTANNDDVIIVGEENESEGVVMKRDSRALWALGLSMPVMQSAFLAPVNDNSISSNSSSRIKKKWSEFFSSQQENALNGSITQTQTQSYLGTVSSELLLWVVECIWDVLASPNYSNHTHTFATPKKTTRHLHLQQQQQQQQSSSSSSTLLASSLKQQQHVDPTDAEGKMMKKKCQDEANTTDHKLEGTQCLSYHWTHFDPFTSSSSSSLQRGSKTTTTTTTTVQTPILLTEDELLQISLLQQFLAEVGVQMELGMRFCYDNEEDAVLLFPVEGPLSSTSSGNTSGMEFSPSQRRVRTTTSTTKISSSTSKTSKISSTSTVREESPLKSTTVRCVGKEANLSLHVDPAFLGSRVWEVLADAWLKALITLRAKNVSLSQHVRRKYMCTDVVECMS